MMSLSAYAMTDNELCERYGVEIASNDSEGRIELISEINSRIESKTWSLSAKQCDEIAMYSKAEYELDLAIYMWPD